VIDVVLANVVQDNVIRAGVFTTTALSGTAAFWDMVCAIPCTVSSKPKSIAVGRIMYSRVGVDLSRGPDEKDLRNGIGMVLGEWPEQWPGPFTGHPIGLRGM
jgi:hypothetical protein